MNPIAVLKRVSAKNILKVIFIGLRRPLLVFPTIRATRKCISISSKIYGKLHHKNGPANAFRHVLWNYLIATNCRKWSSNDLSAITWTKKITDWHEHAFPNSELAKRMDFHNNEVGRLLFLKYRSKSENEIIEMLRQMTMASAQITDASDLFNHKNQLVHIFNQ